MTGIVDYGTGNLRSVQKALEYLGEKTVVSSDMRALDGCRRLVLPGVGSFGAGMENVKRAGLDGYVRRRVADTPLLGICLGMQLFLSASAEEGEFEGLDLIQGRAERFARGKIPHMGWNGVTDMKGKLFAGLEDGEEFYFVHSYYADTAEEFTAGKTDYFGAFASAIAKGNAYGVQFHPEKSGDAGLRLLENFTRI